MRSRGWRTRGEQRQHENRAGGSLYLNQCAFATARPAGHPPRFPSLVGVAAACLHPQITSLIQQGKGRMPAVPKLSTTQIASLYPMLSNTR